MRCGDLKGSGLAVGIGVILAWMLAWASAEKLRPAPRLILHANRSTGKEFRVASPPKLGLPLDNTADRLVTYLLPSPNPELLPGWGRPVAWWGIDTSGRAIDWRVGVSFPYREGNHTVFMQSGPVGHPRSPEAAR